MKMPRDSFIKVIKNATCKPKECTHFKWRIMLLFEFYGEPQEKKRKEEDDDDNDEKAIETTTFFWEGH